MNPLPVLEEVNETNEQVSILRNQGFPSALARALALQSTRAFPLRLLVVDNSGSMREADGRRLVASSTKENVKWVQTTRWEELKVNLSWFMCHVGVVAFSMRRQQSNFSLSLSCAPSGYSDISCSTSWITTGSDAVYGKYKVENEVSLDEQDVILTILSLIFDSC